jgi:hypothetical protein
MFRHPEYEAMVAKERFRFIREDFEQTRGHSNLAIRFRAVARHTGRLLIWLGARLVHYSYAEQTPALLRPTPPQEPLSSTLATRRP